MKIEICEQMVQSWLQHIKGCQIVQTNWMISPLHVPSNIPYVEWFMTDIAEALNTEIDAQTLAEITKDNAVDDAGAAIASGELSGEDVRDEELLHRLMDCFATLNKKETTAMRKIFGDSKPEQFITQCEIDVVGVRFDGNNGVEKIYLVDSAFHKGSLNYGDETVARVLKKLIRACIVSKLVFGSNVPVEVAFVTPYCTDGSGKKVGMRTKIRELTDILRDILKKRYSPAYDNIEIELYFNERFADELYAPLKAQIDTLNNDNDLFMRSMNLAKIAEKYMTKPSAPVPVPAATAGVRKYTEDDKLQVALYYLTHMDGLEAAEEAVLGRRSGGALAKDWLNRLGVDTSRGSAHKGLLDRIDIDDAIATATGMLKTTMESIKNKGWA